MVCAAAPTSASAAAAGVERRSMLAALLLGGAAQLGAASPALAVKKPSVCADQDTGEEAGESAA